MFPIRPLALVALTATLPGLNVDAALYTQDFESFDTSAGNASDPTITALPGAYNGANVIGTPANSFNGTNMMFADTDTSVETRLVINTGLTVSAGESLDLTYDLGTAFGIPGPFEVSIYVDTVQAAFATLGSDASGNGLTLSAPAGNAGFVYLDFFGGATGNGYGQYQIDNITLRAVPEPAALSMTAAAALLIGRRRR